MTTAARFGDERAETMLNMAKEALRNVERHARATHVIVTLKSIDESHLELRVEDNGVGFDPRAATSTWRNVYEASNSSKIR